MEVSVEGSDNIPAGSILSVRAGTVRKQGQLSSLKEMRFTTSTRETNPFIVDLLVPLASKRVILRPDAEHYAVDFGNAENPNMRVNLKVLDSGHDSPSAAKPEARDAKTEARKEKQVGDCNAYVEKHRLMQFMQNLMQSILMDRPDDPFKYMEQHLTAANAPAPTRRISRVKTMVGGAADKKEVLSPQARSFEGAAFDVQDASGAVGEARALRLQDLVPEGAEIRRLQYRMLSDTFPSRAVETPLKGMIANFQGRDSYVTEALVASGEKGQSAFYDMLCAGPRASLHFDPKDVVATIVTCGGLCPGLNSVVRQIVLTLYTYGVRKIFGIRGGYKGVTNPEAWIELTPDVVQGIHDLGGTILASDRGNPPIEDQVRSLKEAGVRQHFVIGGDGTHRGADETSEQMSSSGWECSVIGIPKTIDNDIPMLDRTFGFDTACTEATKAIHSAYVEATCNANCIGLVKLMGRHCGFIAMHSVLAARYVDMCLLPEMEIDLEKVLKHCTDLLQAKGHAVIVVAEGCGGTLLSSSGEKDAGGNVKLADVGPWLRDKILDRFKQVRLPCTIKYIDPTYMIRAVRPNANDSVYCAVLGENAVHAAMAGYTGVTLGKVSSRQVLLPMQAITQQKPKRVNLSGRWFVRMLATTLQPDLKPDGAPQAPAEPKAAGGDDAMLAISAPVSIQEVLGSGEVRRLELEHLGDAFGRREVPTKLHERAKGGNLRYLDGGCWITQTLGVRGQKKIQVNLQMLQAGPRGTLHFKPEDVAAAIVTCGGLCPGLNSVIRELVMMLYAYGVKKVYGIKGGFKGVASPQTWLTLTPENVKDIHMQGGTALVSDRGGPPEDEMARVLKSKGIRQYFVIGGDGTHRGAYATYQAVKDLGWECSVVGIPKTIDNDISLLDRTFGFDTACSEAVRSINSAYVEARCNANCIGLVKLMGRHCGYLSMMSVLAARYVDICLLPEMDVSLEKVLEHAVDLMKTQGYAVIVVAEGCGETLMEGSGEKDAGGNAKLPEVGTWLKDTVLAHFKSLKLPLTIKYVDPTYTVRAIPANANDSIYCSNLAQGGVHAAMAGYTGVTVAKVCNAFVYLPIRTLTGMPNRKVEIGGAWYEKLLAATLQPNLSHAGLATAKPDDPWRRHNWARAKTHGFEEAVLDAVKVPGTRFMAIDGYGETKEARALERTDILAEHAQVRKLKCFHLSERFGTFSLPSPLRSTRIFQDSLSWTSQSMCRGLAGGSEAYFQMVRSGPREHLHFDPNDPAACAAIVSCGGICPGLNSVIRELVMTLWDYGVRRIYGIKGGYKGVVQPETWLKLTPDLVRDIHTQGGTMLVSDRGAPPVAEMVKVLKEQGVRQYFVLGGDGTHRGAMETFQQCLEEDYECAVIGVPKTIDNDVPLLDQTFGFDTACTEAERAVDSAYVEATCNANAIGLVKLMGRHCGFIAMNAVLSARHVDICLIPEMDIDLEKVLAHAVHLMKTQGYAVIVVAEGCGETLLQGTGERDAGGNKIMADAGIFLKDAIAQRFKQEQQPVTIKYIDPTYMIRSVPANAFDSKYCSALAQSAVHGALAGYSGVTVGKINERHVYLPIHAITQQAGPRVDTSGSWFQRLLETTKQPSFARDGAPQGPGLTEEAVKKRKVLENLSAPGSINMLLEPGDEVRRLELVSLGDSYPSAGVPNPVGQKEQGKLQYMTGECWTTKTFYRFNRRDDRGHVYYQALLGGPRERLHFDPAKSAAVIVTCGGLCPGLNSVIREIVMTLNAYGVPRVYGCRGGYKGMVEPDAWMQLTPESVRNIHMQGGTILVSDRGNPPAIDIARVLQSRGITHYFIIGGDGTHRGAMEVFNATQEIKYECSVVGIPKTIDNDIPILDRSFGFNTACTEAVAAIQSAYVEATSNRDCIGLVKLMGRHCGWIALEAVMAARHVDVCLLPEMDVSLPKLLSHLIKLVKTQGFAVVVVAEGCGDTLIRSSGETDAGGNKMLADVGPWLQAQILKYFKKMQVPTTIKFIDPTYTIRAVPANANDSVYCSVLAQHAVHGGMSGYSGITVGKVDERYVMLPIHAITKMEKSRKVEIKSRAVERLLTSTGQPDLAPGPGDDWALLPPAPPPKAEEEALEFDELDNIAFKRVESGGAVPSEEEEGAASAATLRAHDGFGAVAEERPLKRGDLMGAGDELRKLEVMRLSDRSQRQAAVASPLRGQARISDFIPDDSWAVQTLPVTDGGGGEEGAAHYQMLRAGPRERLYFDPADAGACAAVLTAGGLCPGENAAVREIVCTLKKYGVARVYGIRGGLMGITDEASWTELTLEDVREVHQQGGTFLKSHRGNPLPEDAAAALKARGVRQFFALGGDGTMKGVLQIFTALDKLGHECACLGVPSTINGDVPLSDRTFGFDTACTVARDSITAAYVEATCNANCIGLVKLTGERSGFLALEAALASRHVDICLLPEMEVDVEKVLDQCEHLMRTKKYAVVVVTDGCSRSLLRDKPGEDNVGPWLKDAILARFKAKGMPLTIKYIDPTYMLRSVQVNAYDAVYSSTLAEHAVHGAMAGVTGAMAAKVCRRNVYLPLQVISKSPGLRVDPRGRNMARLRFTTQQPAFEPDGFDYGPPPDTRVYLKEISTPLSLKDVLRPGTEIKRLRCASLGDAFAGRAVQSPLKGTALKGSVLGAFVPRGAWSCQTLQHRAEGGPAPSYLQLERCGPREALHFDPSEPGMSAAVVTCGGLCPGLNDVIRELAKMLHVYGVKTVHGVVGGFKGFEREESWIDLTPETVQDINMRGGSILVSDRGNPPHSKIAEVMKKRNVRCFFVLGGDGTHKGAMQSFEAMTAIGHECAVVGVPKTIDNDIQLLDRSFGFDTACTEARKAIDSAYVEASTNANCIGLVKLMGRHCGWIAATATLAARHVDVCLVPEMNISKDKLLAYVAEVMRRQRRAVIVVAEGCGDTIIKSSGEKDAGGNAKLADVGPYLKDEITKHLKAEGIPVTIKYIDPTYMVRSVPANAYDSRYCAALAQEAVHAAMAGYTGISVGKVDESYVMVPIHAITEKGPRKLDTSGRVFGRLMATTAQPSFEP